MHEIVPDESQYFECLCHSSEHTLKFYLDPDDNIIHSEVFFHQYRSFFKRLLLAVKYLFGYKCRYGHWRPEDARRMQSLLNKLEQECRIND